MSDRGSPDLDRLVDEIVSGERNLRKLPRHLSAADAALVRRRAIERTTEVELEVIGAHGLDAERVAECHCENFIGATQIPVGVVGPLWVRGDEIDGSLYVPLATTEGALLASINRGCSAVRRAGGARVFVEDVGMTRAPVFRTEGLEQTRELIDWLENNRERVREVAESTSRYLRLEEVKPFAIGTTVFLRFRFRSGDAMGMNMATIACDRVVHELIEIETGIPCIALSGNYCVDKKAAAINFQEGRGKRIQAEVRLSREVLAWLKTDAKALAEVQYRKNLMGSIAAGSTGFNAHVANVVAAFFLATGQDPAHVVEAAMGVTCLEPIDDGGLIASVFLPDVPLAAVGGGTSLGPQREALDMLGVHADPDRPGAAAMRLAEILGAAVLAGELSLMAALSTRDLASAHARLGRRQDG